MPLVGMEDKKLKEKEKQHQRMSVHLRRQMLSEYQCTQCKRVWSGKIVRVKWDTQRGLKVELLVCPDKRCDGPVVIYRDALDLTNPPHEERVDLKKTRWDEKDMANCTAATFSRFRLQEFTKGGMGTQVEIGREVQCSFCAECVVLKKDGKWEVSR